MSLVLPSLDAIVEQPTALPSTVANDPLDHADILPSSASTASEQQEQHLQPTDSAMQEERVPTSTNIIIDAQAILLQSEVVNPQPIITAPEPRKHSFVAPPTSSTPLLVVKEEAGVNCDTAQPSFSTPPSTAATATAINPTSSLSGNNNNSSKTLVGFNLSGIETSSRAGQPQMRAHSLSVGSGSMLSSQARTPKTPALPQFQAHMNTSTTTAQSQSPDISNFTTLISSQPYLFFQTNNMHIHSLEASQDDLYTVFTFLVPNQPIGNTSTNNSYVQNHHQGYDKNSYSLSSKNRDASPLLKHNGGAPSLLSSNLSAQSSTQLQNMIAATPLSANGKSSSGFQKSSDARLAPKVPGFGLGVGSGQGQQEKKTNNAHSSNGTSNNISSTNNNNNSNNNNGGKGQSLVDLIKSQWNPEDEKKKKSGTSANHGISNKSYSATNLSSNVQQQNGPGLSESSIASLYSLSMNQFSNIHNFSSLTHIPEENNLRLHHLHKPIIPDQKADQQKSQLEIEDQGEENEDEESGAGSISEEEGYGDADDDSDEEARVIREIQEMKRKKANGEQLFDGGDGGDFFDLYDDKFIGVMGGGGSGSGKRSKKNGGAGSHKNKFDTKNLVKNFLNSFSSFVIHPDEEATILDVLSFSDVSQLNDFRATLRNFFKGKKFNRVLLKEFIFEEVFRPLFLFFLENRALSWIEGGRMKDKASHLRALKNFIFVCQNHEQIKSWRFRYNFVQN